MRPVFLDACVLYPRLLRRIALGAAASGLVRVAWSPRVLAEWRLAAIRDGGALAGMAVEGEAALMAAHHPGACVAPGPGVERALTLPDADDTHVLAAAIAAGASAIITLNLRDFPAHALAPHGLVARHPDGWLWQMPQAALAPAIRAAFAELGVVEPDPIRAGLKRARLPRLAKSWV